MQKAIIACTSLRHAKTTASVAARNDHNRQAWAKLRKLLFSKIRLRSPPNVLQFTSASDIVLITECDEQNDEHDVFYVNGTEILAQLVLLGDHKAFLQNPITILQLHEADLQLLVSLQQSNIATYVGYVVKALPALAGMTFPSASTLATKMKDVHRFAMCFLQIFGMQRSWFNFQKFQSVLHDIKRVDLTKHVRDSNICVFVIKKIT
jgi:hypothetical protein